MPQRGPAGFLLVFSFAARERTMAQEDRMAKHRIRRRRAEAKTPAPRASAGAMPADSMQPPTPSIREMMVMAGNRPHETILHDSTLEDFGLDVPSIIHPDHP
jgi:hypothetical protein